MGFHDLLQDSSTLLYVNDVPTSRGTHCLLQRQLYFSYVSDVRTSQETYIRASTVRYEDGFNCLYVDDVRTSQGTHIRASTACYGDRFIFYVQMTFLPHRKHTYRPPRSVTEIVLHFLLCMYDNKGRRCRQT
jgi:hypothetical protein